MKKIKLAGILTMAFVLFAACGTESQGDVASLEPHSLEATGAASDIGVNEELSSASNDAGRIPSSTGAEAAAPGNVSANAESRSDDTGAGSGQGAPASGASTGTQSVVGGSSDAYGDIYLRKVNENESNARRYSLIYLDVDEIPELVINMGDESYSIYTVKDNELFCLADSVGTVELTYFERSGVIAVFSRWNGGGDEGGYGSSYYQTSRDRTLTYDDQPVLSYSYNASYDEKGIYMGTGVTDYFYMGQEIDEAAYQEKMKSLGIAEGEDRLCMENSYSKEEITALLNR